MCLFRLPSFSVYSGGASLFIRDRMRLIRRGGGSALLLFSCTPIHLSPIRHIRTCTTTPLHNSRVQAEPEQAANHISGKPSLRCQAGLRLLFPHRICLLTCIMQTSDVDEACGSSKPTRALLAQSPARNLVDHFTSTLMVRAFSCLCRTPNISEK